MTPAHPQVITTSIQAWKLIEKDFTLRLSLLAHRFAEEHQRAKSVLLADARSRGNSAYLGPAWVDMEIADTNKRAEWSYKACCEVWKIQGRTKCRVFFRAVFDWCLQPLFSVRAGCFKSELDTHQIRTRCTFPQANSAILGHMKREMDRLRANWNTKLEIATRDNEHQQQLARQRDFENERDRLVQLAATSQVNRTNPMQSQETTLLRAPEVFSPFAGDKKARKPGPRTDVQKEAFRAVAGKAWRSKQRKGDRVSAEDLLDIARQLDAAGLAPPKDYLEKKASKDLREYNRQNAPSKHGAITTWERLVQNQDKDQLRAMRKLLSRSAGIVRN
jgi:hypothetical protein